jgi:dipeptidyl aminopeptidase/acylaminoacyl peptidase
VTRFEERRTLTLGGRLALVCLLGLLLVWLGVPAVRAGLLLATSPFRSGPARPAGLAVESVRFHAADGVPISGWLVPASPRAPTVILVPGFKSDRASMVPYARFLHTAGFNVLLYDSRGTGASGGAFSLGLREVRDVEGAVAYLERRPNLRGRRYGLLGVSLGSGVAIVAGSRLPDVRAIVADSPYVDERPVVQRLDTLRLGRLSLPLAPIAPWVVDQLLGAPLASFNPLRSAGRLGGRGLLLIHSRHDANPTTPLEDALSLQRAAGRNAALWIAPRGRHAGALAAQPGEYGRRVVAFLWRYLH